MERGRNDMRWISIVLMRKINCQNRLYFQKIVLPFVLDKNINQRLPLQTTQSPKKSKAEQKLPAHIAAVRNMGKKEKRLQTLRQALRGP